MCKFNQSVHPKVYNQSARYWPGRSNVGYRTLLGSASELIERFHPRDLGLCNLSKQKKSFRLKKVQLPHDLALFAMHLVQCDSHGFIWKRSIDLIDNLYLLCARLVTLLRGTYGNEAVTRTTKGDQISVRLDGQTAVINLDTLVRINTM